MAGVETELEMVRRHVAQGERHVALQQEIIAHLRELGGSTELAESLLTEFQQVLRSHREHLSRIDPGFPEKDSSKPRSASV